MSCPGRGWECTFPRGSTLCLEGPASDSDPRVHSSPKYSETATWFFSANFMRAAFMCFCPLLEPSVFRKKIYCWNEMKLNTTEYFWIKYYIWMQYTWWCVALESSFTNGLIWNMLGYNLGPAPIRKCWKEREALALVKKEKYSKTVKN